MTTCGSCGAKLVLEGGRLPAHPGVGTKSQCGGSFLLPFTLK